MSAENRLKKTWTRIDSILTTRYFRLSQDTDYIVRPEGRLTLQLKGNQTGNGLHARGTVNNVYSNVNLHTKHKTTVSISAAYRGLSAAFSLNPAKLGGIYKDYELNINYYGSRICIDASYQRSSSLSGDVEIGDRKDRIESGDVNMKVFNMTGYYIFNHRHFSFPAAFTQGYIQRRSAGSLLAGFSYQGGRIKMNDDLKERKPNAPDVYVSVGHFGVGAGYGYNLVLGKKWLFHLSLLPTMVFYNRNNLTVNGNRVPAREMRINVILNERAAIVYNFSSRYFAGATLVMSNSFFDNDAIRVNQNKWIARAFFGMRL